MGVMTGTAVGADKEHGAQLINSELQDKGFVVVGFPCNQFASQDPGDDAQIANFCQKNYGVSFQMMSKVKVNGARTKPAKEIKINDLVEFKAGWDDRAVLVTALSDIRRGAAEAARLFEETAASLQNRETARLKRASLGPMPKGERPTKRDRRQIHRLVSRPDS